MKRLLTCLMALLFGIPFAYAVMPEKDIDMTVRMLQKELEMLKNDIEFQKSQYETARRVFWDETAVLEGELDRAALVLHSQSENWLFRMAQASQLAHDATARFSNRQYHIEKFFGDVNSTIKRVHETRMQLNAINRENLSPAGEKSIEVSMSICNELEDYFKEYMKMIKPDRARYALVSKRVKDLDEQNHQTLSDLYSYIFVKGNEPYGSVLANFLERGKTVVHDIDIVFSNGSDSESDSADTADSGGSMYDFWISLLVSIVSYIIFRKQKKSVALRKYASYWAMILFLTFSMLFDIFELLFTDIQSYDKDDYVLGIQLFLCFVLVLLVHVVNGYETRLRHVLMLYAPLLFLSFIVIEYISSQLPLSAVVLSMPFIYLFYLLVQLPMNFIIRKRITPQQRRFGWASIAIVFLCLVMAWTGFTVASMIVFLTWNTIWIIILIVYLLHKYIGWKVSRLQSPLLDYTMRWLVYPALWMTIIVGSSYWVSSIFNLTSWFKDWLLMPFVDIPDVCQVSVAKIIMIVILGMLIRYSLGVIKHVLMESDSEKYGSGNAAVAMTVGTIFAWLGYAVAVVVILRINHTGIIAAIGGASVGLGFAMRDTFENFFYGLTMMAGRARPGDIVECEGIRGHISSVGIIATSIETEDGPIVSMPNRQLFGRHFKNLTLNNRREIRHITYDISEQNDIEKAKDLMLKTGRSIEGIVDPENHYVVAKYIGCGMVRLDYKCWIDSELYLRVEPAVREAIFNAFCENGIISADIVQTLNVKTATAIVNG